MSEKLHVHLTAAQRADLRGMLTAGTAPAQSVTHARTLLKADESPDGPAWSDRRIAEAFEVSELTVWRVRTRCVEHGLAPALTRKAPDRVYHRKLDGRAEAHLVALACSAPPMGRRCWTLQLLADRLVELKPGVG